MTQLPAALRALLLCAIFTTAHAIPPRAIFERQDQSVCSQRNRQSCPSGLPDNFCCPAGTYCLALAGNTTVLCCDDGLSCDELQVVPCNLSLQNPDRNPIPRLMTSVLEGAELPRCGQHCCPFGYSCEGKDERARCVKDKDQSEPPAGAEKPAPTSTPEPTKTGAPSTTKPTVSVPTGAAEQDKEEPETNKKQDDKAFPTTAVVLGVLFGVLGIVGAVVVALVCISRRRKKKGGHARSKSLRNSTASSSFGNMISEPMVDHGYGGAVRTDFIRKPEGARSTHSSGLSSTQRISRLLGRDSSRDSSHDPSRVSTRASGPSYVPQDSPAASSGRTLVQSAAVAPIRGMFTAKRASQTQKPPRPAHPETPRLQREPSSESINVFAAPGTVDRNERPLTSGTSFTDMMNQADLGDVHKGRPFVPPLDTPPQNHPSRGRGYWEPTVA